MDVEDAVVSLDDDFIDSGVEIDEADEMVEETVEVKVLSVEEMVEILLIVVVVVRVEVDCEVVVSLIEAVAAVVDIEVAVEIMLTCEEVEMMLVVTAPLVDANSQIAFTRFPLKIIPSNVEALT